MASRALGTDITALIHHVQLNESGWIDRAIGRALKFILWLNDTPLSVDEIVSNQSIAGLHGVSQLSITKSIEDLRDAGELVETPNELYKLSEEERRRIDYIVNKAEDTEKFVRDKVLIAASSYKDPFDDTEKQKTWDEFHRKFIIPFIQSTGAKSYELITGQSAASANDIVTRDIKSRFPDSEQEMLTLMIEELFDVKSIECRTYILRLLNSYFFESALRLPNDVIKRIFDNSGRKPRLRLVLDTNFLFSLLSLHANPSNEAVKFLVSIIKKIQENIDIKLFVIPKTIDEFQRSLVNYESAASNIRVTRNIVEAGIRVHLSGVMETYLERCRSSNYQINPKEYFAPYYENIKSILKDKGVEILQISDETTGKDQRIIDDTLDRVAFYQRKYINQPERQKRHEQVWHDVVLWYTINDRRPSQSTSFFEADWLGVTIDYSLIGFDSIKRRGSGIPCMVHPSSLAQALQLLLPQTESFDDAMFTIIKLPLLVEEYDIEDERETQKILGLLSRYEKIDDLSVETVSDLLENRDLKAKIQKAENESAEFTLIKEAIIEHAANIESQYKESVDLLNKYEARSSMLNNEVNTLRDEKSQSEIMISSIQDEMRQMRDSYEELHRTAADFRELVKVGIYTLGSTLVVLILSIIIYNATWEYISQNFNWYWAALVALSPVPVGLRVLLLAVDISQAHATASKFTSVIRYVHAKIWWVYGFILLSIAAPVIWENIKVPLGY